MADTSMYNKLTEQPSFMDKAAGFMSLLQGANQNRVAIGQREAGKEIQNAINPLDGTVDSNKLFSGLKANPLVAPAAAEAVQNAQTIEQGKIGIDQAKFNLIHNQIDFTRQTLGSLVADPDLTQAKVIEATGKLIAQGIITPQMAATEIASMPKDPAELKKFVLGHLVNTMSAAEKFTNTFGAPQLISGKDQNTGADTLTPVAVPAIPGMPVRVQGAAPAPGTEAPGAGAPASPLNQQTGAITTGLPAGQEKAFEDSAAAYQDATKDIAALPARILTLNKALKNLAIADTGKQSGWYNDMKSFLITVAGPEIAAKIGANPDKVAAYDEAKKYLVQYAQQSAQNFGGGTDSQLATALTANASTDISNMAAQDVVKTNIALERMKLARLNDFKATGQNQNQFTNFSGQWGQNIDPVAFSVDLMGRDKLKTYLSGLTPEAKQRFINSVNIGLKTGALDKSAVSAAFGKGK